MGTLEDLGYNPEIEKAAKELLSPGSILARVTEEHRQRYTIRHEGGEVLANIAGRMIYQANARNDFPAVGDWVIASLLRDKSQAVIQKILPRKTILERKAPGKPTKSQVLAVNIDVVLIVHALDQQFNTRKLERSLVLVRESGALPKVFLSKRDLCSPEEVNVKLNDARQVCGTVEVSAYSVFNEEDLKHLSSSITPGLTFCLLGSSGSGKSTLINALVGSELLATGDVREYDAKGRHTTSMRQLVISERGGIFIDTPGLRELGLWQADAGLNRTFEDIEALARQCSFRDCTHVHEPDCAVQQAVQQEALSIDRYQSYLQLQKELLYLDSRKDRKALKERKEKEKKESKKQKKILLTKRNK